MILFYLREVAKSIKRARLSFALSLITTCISVILVVISVILVKSSRIMEKSIKEKIVITLFLKDADSSRTVQSIEQNLRALSYINSVKYMDKKEASEKFLKETGEDFRNVLDYNPLPSSIEVLLKPEYINKNAIARIVSELKELDGVEDVIFESEVLYKILEILYSIKVYIFIAAFFLITVSFYIVFSTNKLIINSRHLEIETMKLVGAKQSVIRLPVILNGLIIGSISSVVSFILIKLLFMSVGKYFDISSVLNELFIIYFFAFISGPIIGLFASLLSVQKITLRLS